MKQLTDIQFAFKAAVRRAVTAAGGCTAAAEVVRVDAARLSRYGNADAPEFAPVDVCFDLDAAAGDNVVLRAWANLAGFELVARESVERQVAKDLTALAGPLAREAGELVSTAIEAAADGKVSPNEAKRLHAEAADVIDLGVRIQNAARRSMGAA